MANKGKWVSVNLVDGVTYEGTLEEEMPYGIYIHIGGDNSRLSMFPWHIVARVIYRDNI
jgi:hypothetical protein